MRTGSGDDVLLSAAGPALDADAADADRRPEQLEERLATATLLQVHPTSNIQSLAILILNPYQINQRIIK